MELPDDYSSLATAYNSPANTVLSVIGVVVDFFKPTITAKGDHMLTFRLLDQHIRESVYGSQGLSVRFFKKNANDLPKIDRLGDVVLLTDVKMMPFGQQPLLQASWQTGVLVFPWGAIPDPAFEISFLGNSRLPCHGHPKDQQRLRLVEQRYVIYLKDSLKSTVEALPSLSTNPSNLPPRPPATNKRSGGDLPSRPAKRTNQSTLGPKYQLVKDLRHRVFADICAQVVKKFPTQSGACDLYVTDYTENKEMFLYAPPEETADPYRDGDTFGYAGPQKRSWPGPWGQLVLKVNVKDPHALYVNREVNEGDIVLLKNVKMKIMAEGSKLEGDMWPDHLNLEKVCAFKLTRHDTPEIRSLLDRKAAYWESRAGKSEPAQNHPQKLSRAEKRQKKRQMKAERVKPSNDGVTESKGKSGPTNANRHVRCIHEDVALTSIRDIRDPEHFRHTNTTPEGVTYILPFVNAKYRAKVRIVDFAPKNLADFAYEETWDDDNKSISSVASSTSPCYKWAFSFLLEDANTAKDAAPDECRIWANLSHEEAQYLFGRSVEDPTNLGKDRRLLAVLKEKLCILWGNLEEKRPEESLSNLPFECCLMEYGYETDESIVGTDERPFGYRRMYRFFGVTIL